MLTIDVNVCIWNRVISIPFDSIKKVRLFKFCVSIKTIDFVCKIILNIKTNWLRQIFISKYQRKKSKQILLCVRKKYVYMLRSLQKKCTNNSQKLMTFNLIGYTFDQHQTFKFKLLILREPVYNRGHNSLLTD